MEIGYRLGAYERFACITRNFLIRTSTDTTRVSTRASPTQKQSTVVFTLGAKRAPFMQNCHYSDYNDDDSGHDSAGRIAL